MYICDMISHWDIVDKKSIGDDTITGLCLDSWDMNILVILVCSFEVALAECFWYSSPLFH
jgi:hypothetical protein